MKQLQTVPALMCSMLIAASTASIGCESCESALSIFREPTPETDNPAQFTAGPLEFSYPGNWSTESETFVQDGITVTVVHVESVGSAYLGVQLYTPTLETSPEELFETMSQELPQKISTVSSGIVTSDLGEVSTFQRQFIGEERTARRLSMGVHVIGEQVPHTISGYCAHLPENTVSVFTMISDEDLDRAQPGFDLVLDTIQVRSLGASEENGGNR